MPIALYVSEIWGIDSLNFKHPSKLSQTLTSPLSEKLNLSISRYTLGVHKKAQNSAVGGELGRLPLTLGIDIACTIAKYYEYLQSKGEGTLMNEAFELGKTLARSNPDQKKLWQCQYNLMNQLLPRDNRHRNNKSRVRAFTESLYINHWSQLIEREPKMRTYKLFKSSFHMENYLSFKNAKQRKAMSRLRISAHRLAVEIGRYRRPPVPLEQRTCPHCPEEVIEDEFTL